MPRTKEVAKRNRSSGVERRSRHGAKTLSQSQQSQQSAQSNSSQDSANARLSGAKSGRSGVKKHSRGPLRKYRRWNPTDANKRDAISHIKDLQKRTENLIPRRPFERLIREVGQSVVGAGRSGDIRFTQDALSALQEASEAYVIEYFMDAQEATLHTPRITVMRPDFELVRRLRERVTPLRQALASHNATHGGRNQS